MVTDKFIEGFALTGEIASGLKDKSFEIMEVPRYEEMQDFKDPEKTVKRMILKVKLADGMVVDWFPNKTAQSSILASRGFVRANWLGYKGKFSVKEVQIGKEFKKAVFVE